MYLFVSCVQQKLQGTGYHIPNSPGGCLNGPAEGFGQPGAPSRAQIAAARPLGRTPEAAACLDAVCIVGTQREYVGYTWDSWDMMDDICSKYDLGVSENVEQPQNSNFAET